MRREVILLVAGLAAVAALPVQESAASSLQSDLLSIILGANPEENDLAAEHNDNLLVAHTKTDEQTSHSEEGKEQPQPQSQSQDPPQEQQQTQLQDASLEQLKQLGSEIKSVEESLLSEGSDEKLGEDSKPEETEARPEPQPKLVNPQDFSYISEEPDDETANFDPEMEALPFEPDDRYVVLKVNKGTPSLDSGGTFVYKAQNEPIPFDQSDSEEPQMEPLLHDYKQEPLSFEPKMDSFSPEPEESQSQMNPLPYDWREPLSSEEPLSDPQMDSFLLNKEPLESDYEQLSLGITEGPDAQYDYRSSVEGDQSDLEEDMSSEPGVPAEDSYHAAQDVTPVNLFSWLIPDFLDEEPTDYDELPHASSYHNEAMVVDDRLPINPEVHYEPEVMEDMNQEEPSGSEVNEAAAPSDDSLLGGGDDVVVVGKAVPLIVGLKEDGDDVSLADFFIPTYDGSTYSSAPQDYSSNGIPEDGSQELVSDDGTYSVDDGLVHVEPTLRIDTVDEEQDQPDTMTFGGFLFPENNPFEDGRSIVPWSTENDESDQKEYPEKDTEITILESQPMYIPNKGINKPHPILLEFQDKETDESDEPWNNPKSLVIDFTPDADTEYEESLSTEENYLSSSLDNDGMDIIVIKESGETFDDFPTSPLIGGPAVTRGQSIPFTQYPKDQRQSPYWVRQRIPDQQVPTVYFSVVDEPPRRKLPTFFEHLNEDLSFSTPISHRRLQAPVMRDPFTFMNEITEDDMPPQFLASPSTQSQFRFMGPDTSSSPRNYQNSFETPRVSFRDLLRHLNPSSVQSPPLYHPQSYNSFPHYTSPPVPYSWPSDYSIETDYSPVKNYYPDRSQGLSYESNDVPSNLFREDTMSDLYSNRPQRHFSDYSVDHPFMPTDSFTSPRPRFPFLQRPRYAGNSPSYNKPQYSQNRFYSTGPYHPTPIYPIYAPEYYGI